MAMPPIAMTWFGRHIEVQQRGGKIATFEIKTLSQTKTSVCENGVVNNHVCCINILNSKEIMTLHPDHLARVFANGEDSGVKLVGYVTTTQPKNIVSPKPFVRKQLPPATSKKERAIIIYKTMKAKGASRQEIIQALIQQLDMTPAGAGTYYQNIKKELS